MPQSIRDSNERNNPTCHHIKKNQSHLPSNKIYRNKPKEIRYLYSENSKTLMKQTEDDTDWKIIPILGLEETQGNLPIQGNLYQNTNGIFYIIRTNNPKICMKTQKTLNSQNYFEKEEQSWRNNASWLQGILQSNNNRNILALAQKSDT